MTGSITLVCIRGLLREARHWGVFTALLQRRFPEAQIITPDIPGNGRFNHLISPDSIAGMTDALRAQVASRRNLTLIAISMGGMIAIDWMTRYPDEVQSAVLINTSVRRLSPFYQRLRFSAGLHILKMLFHSPAQRETDILALTSNQYANDATQLATWQSWQRQNPVSFRNAIRQFLAATKFIMHTQPQQPVLVVAGQADRLVDYRCSIRLAEILCAAYVQHETAGHDLPLDEPEWLVETIYRWMVSNGEVCALDKACEEADGAVVK